MFGFPPICWYDTNRRIFNGGSPTGPRAGPFFCWLDKVGRPRTGAGAPVLMCVFCVWKAGIGADVEPNMKFLVKSFFDKERDVWIEGDLNWNLCYRSSRSVWKRALAAKSWGGAMVSVCQPNNHQQPFFCFCFCPYVSWASMGRSQLELLMGSFQMQRFPAILQELLSSWIHGYSGTVVVHNEFVDFKSR